MQRAICVFLSTRGDINNLYAWKISSENYIKLPDLNVIMYESMMKNQYAELSILFGGRALQDSAENDEANLE